MKATGKVIAWECILSSFLMGCYSSVTISPRIPANAVDWVVTRDGMKLHFTSPPTLVEDAIAMSSTGDEKHRIHSKDIGCVITKDGMENRFDEPPVIVCDTIVTWRDDNKQDWRLPDRIDYVILRDGTKHIFDSRPAISDFAVVYYPSISIPVIDVVQFSSGDANGRVYMDRLQYVVTKDGTKYEFATPPTISPDLILGVPVNKSISLPRSDLAFVSGKDFSYTKTAGFIVGTTVATFTILIALSGGFDVFSHFPS